MIQHVYSQFYEDNFHEMTTRAHDLSWIIGITICSSFNDQSCNFFDEIKVTVKSLMLNLKIKIKCFEDLGEKEMRLWADSCRKKAKFFNHID